MRCVWVERPQSFQHSCITTASWHNIKPPGSLVAGANSMNTCLKSSSWPTLI